MPKSRQRAKLWFKEFARIRYRQKQLTDGFGGMLSFTIPSGRDEVVAAIGKAQVFKLATALDGAERIHGHHRLVEPADSKMPDNLNESP